jgi:hypothetical protein
MFARINPNSLGSKSDLLQEVTDAYRIYSNHNIEIESFKPVYLVVINQVFIKGIYI